jgi:hypothetical protein
MNAILQSKAFHALVLAAGLTSLGHAALAIDFDSYGGVWNGPPVGTYQDNLDRVIGWTFLVGGSTITVDELGAFDAGKDGLAASHEVGIYEKATKTLVTSALVPAGSAASLESWFRMVPISPVVLQANTEYVIAAGWSRSSDSFVWEPDNGSGMIYLSGFQVTPGLTTGLEGGRFEDTTAILEFPDKIDNLGGPQPQFTRHFFIGPNFSLSSIPEPASHAALLGIGIALLARRERGGRRAFGPV